MTTREIPLTKGYVALVDAEDYDRVMAAGRWSYMTNGARSGHSHVRAVATVDGHMVKMHRLVAGASDPRFHVDHLNGDTLDNRKANLRIVTPKENAANRGSVSAGATGYKGVSLHDGTKYRAQVYDGRHRRAFTGFFPTAEEAARARDAYVREHRDPATERFNFPRPGERGLDGTLVPLDASSTETFSAA